VTGQLAFVHLCRLIWHRGTSVSEETAANFFWVEKSHRSFIIRDSSENLRKINVFLWQKTRDVVFVVSLSKTAFMASTSLSHDSYYAQQDDEMGSVIETI
jgi:hypothetical protein